MSYENINTNSLETTLNKIDNINVDKVSGLINNIIAEQWQGESRKRIVEALKEIEKEYGLIKKEIGNYKAALSYIKEYEKLNSDIATYNSKIINLKNSLKNCDDNNVWNKNYLNSQINSYQYKINTNKTQMVNLKNKIGSLVK